MDFLKEFVIEMGLFFPKVLAEDGGKIPQEQNGFGVN